MVERRTPRTRREFMKAAVAIGSASALSACTERLDGGPDVQTGSLADVPERQHAWNAFLARDDHGNAVAPRHHVVALFDLAHDGAPTQDDREQVAAALDSLNRAYEWSNEGLLVTAGYSPYYFERFDDALSDAVDLPKPKALSPFEEPELDDPDLVVHLASDHAPVVLEAEEALVGNRDAANGVEMAGSFDGVLDRRERRTGFVGAGLPAENQDVDGIPDGDPVSEESPLFMGFKSGFTKNQASEDRVTIQSGPFAEGTTQHLSKIRLRLDDWYGEQDHEARVAEMFCPAHADSGKVEGTGESLGDDSAMDDCQNPADSATEYGRVGHSQKMATDAREDGSPIILRRDFDSTDGGEAGLHFLAVHREIGDFETTRKAMNGEQYTDNPAVRQRVNNGILEYTFVRRRGNYLLPPRSKRALPEPR
ncbi:Dyp-type peroxidase [Halorarius litoreus]|uniref:Dyp-type peroxidase n=1 Tax=Halorarius litoreus TaxID=2962676 RepID=UPI0020CF2058|nr:Dyp-type peroxidase [Halorarius litoreus]